MTDSVTLVYGMFIVIPAVFLIAGLFKLTGKFQSHKLSKSANKLFGLVFVLVGLFQTPLGFNKLMQQMELHNQLAALDPEQLVDIQTPTGVISNLADIQKIAEALRHSDWFLLNHGTITTQEPVTLRFKSQNEVHITLARYSNKEGAVIFRTDADSRSAPLEFSAELPAALKAAGHALPIAEKN